MSRRTLWTSDGRSGNYGHSDAEGHQSTLFDHPCGVPRYLPGMAVRIAHIAAEPTMRWGIRTSQEPSACCNKALDGWFNVGLACNVMSKAERARRWFAHSSHVIVQSRISPSPEHEPVHLVEDDFFVLEDRGPAEPSDVVVAGSGKQGNAERDHGNLLLHSQAFSLARAISAGSLKVLGRQQRDGRTRLHGGRANRTDLTCFRRRDLDRSDVTEQATNDSLHLLKAGSGRQGNRPSRTQGSSNAAGFGKAETAGTADHQPWRARPVSRAPPIPPQAPFLTVRFPALA